MPRVLIAGCGYVGAATADLFHVSGWNVEGWTSSLESAAALSSKPYAIRAVDLTNAEAVAQGASEFEAVIHCASTKGGGAAAYRSIYLEGARNLVAALPKAVLLFMSSTSVYAQTDAQWVTEESPALPERETARVLRETEEFVLMHGGTVARLAGIYGPGRSALLRKFLAGEAVIDPDDRFLNQVHRDDIAAAIMLLTTRAGEGSLCDASRIYNVSDGHPMLQRDCYHWLATHLSRPLPPKTTAPTERKRGKSNKRVSNKKLRALGWEPLYSTFETAMLKSILPALSKCGA